MGLGCCRLFELARSCGAYWDEELIWLNDLMGRSAGMDFTLRGNGRTIKCLEMGWKGRMNQGDCGALTWLYRI